MDGCYYISIGAWAFGWTQLIPTVTSLVLFVLTLYSGDLFFVILGLYLYIPQFQLWVFQYHFQIAHPDPVCQTYQTWAFPSTPAFYTGAVVGLGVAYWYWRRPHFSWLVWLILIGLCVAPPVILVFIGYNRWWEVLFSLGFGMFAGGFFNVVMRYLIRPMVPFLTAAWLTQNYTTEMCAVAPEKCRRTLSRLREAEKWFATRGSAAPTGRDF